MRPCSRSSAHQGRAAAAASPSSRGCLTRFPSLRRPLPAAASPSSRSAPAQPPIPPIARTADAISPLSASGPLRGRYRRRAAVLPPSVRLRDGSQERLVRGPRDGPAAGGLRARWAARARATGPGVHRTGPACGGWPDTVRCAGIRQEPDAGRQWATGGVTRPPKAGTRFGATPPPPPRRAVIRVVSRAVSLAGPPPPPRRAGSGASGPRPPPGSRPAGRAGTARRGPPPRRRHRAGPRDTSGS